MNPCTLKTIFGGWLPPCLHDVVPGWTTDQTLKISGFEYDNVARVHWLVMDWCARFNYVQALELEI